MDKNTFLKEAYAHLKTLPRRATSPGVLETMNQKKSYDFCRYRTEDGLNCAIGHFIPAGHPALDYVGSVHMMLEDYPDLQSVLRIDGMDPWDSTALMLAVQKTHDDTAYWNEDGFFLNFEHFVEHVEAILPEAEADIEGCF